MAQLATGALVSPNETALQDLLDATRFIQQEGAQDIPSWELLVRGQRAPEEDSVDREPDAGRRGWQRFVNKQRERRIFDTYLQALGPTDQARVRSSGGLNAGRWLMAIPCEADLEMESPLHRGAVLRRLGLPIETTGDVCEGTGCNQVLDDMGYHRTTCMRTGRVQTRHTMLKRIF